MELQHCGAPGLPSAKPFAGWCSEKLGLESAAAERRALTLRVRLVSLACDTFPFANHRPEAGRAYFRFAPAARRRTRKPAFALNIANDFAENVLPLPRAHRKVA